MVGPVVLTMESLAGFAKAEWLSRVEWSRGKKRGRGSFHVHPTLALIDAGFRIPNRRQECCRTAAWRILPDCSCSQGIQSWLKCILYLKTSRSDCNDFQAEDQSEQLLLYGDLSRRLVPGKKVRLQFAVVTKAKTPKVQGCQLVRVACGRESCL